MQISPLSASVLHLFARLADMLFFSSEEGLFRAVLFRCVLFCRLLILIFLKLCLEIRYFFIKLYYLIISLGNVHIKVRDLHSVFLQLFPLFIILFVGTLDSFL